jgi:hypothetical protein
MTPAQEFQASPRRKRRKRVAYHEAGHAVIARALGIRVREVVADDEIGQTRFVKGQSAPSSSGLVIAMGGPIAESVYLGKPLWPCGTDRTIAREAMAGITGRSRQAYRRAARRGIRHHWAVIERVAAELIRVGEIDGRRLDELIAEAS